MRRLIPAGWFVAVTPGTRYVTVGGAIAADVHGKNHHRDGSFARHVVEMTLVTPSGVISVAPDRDSELFWATAGGMGLTGVVLSATLRLIPIETSWMQVDSQRFTRLENLMSTMEGTDLRYRYSVAWLDCIGGRNGDHRSVLTRGDHAPSDAIPDRLHGRRREIPGDPRLRVPRTTPRRLVNRMSVRALNEAGSERPPRHEARFARLPGSSIRSTAWPDGTSCTGRRDSCSTSSRCPWSGPTSSRTPSMRSHRRGSPFLAVLKRFGPGTPGPLSFSQEGWTLALDFPLGPPDLPVLLDRLDDAVAHAGGPVYLAKDSRLRPELLPVMYPRLGDLARVRRRVDPERVLASDLSRRLGIP